MFTERAHSAAITKRAAQLIGRKDTAHKAMPFVCAALARHIYHCLKFEDPYDVEKAFGVVTPASEQESLDLEASLDEKFEVMEAHLTPEEG